MLNILSEKSSTSLRAVLDRYYPCLDPSRAEQGADRFPVQFRPHVHHSDRSFASLPSELLCHAVSLAFLAYYDAVLGQPNAAGKHISRLETLAKHWPVLRVSGTPSTGYALVTLEELAELERKLAEAEEQRWDEEDAG